LRGGGRRGKGKWVGRRKTVKAKRGGVHGPGRGPMRGGVNVGKQGEREPTSGIRKKKGWGRRVVLLPVTIKD